MKRNLTIKFLNELKPKYLRSGYPIPKWMIFSETLIKRGWIVKMYAAKTTVSKYLYIRFKKMAYKIRFSDHKANKMAERNKDADFYIGRGNFGTITTGVLLRKLIKKENEYERV